MFSGFNTLTSQKLRSKKSAFYLDISSCTYTSLDFRKFCKTFKRRQSVIAIKFNYDLRSNNFIALDKELQSFEKFFLLFKNLACLKFHLLVNFSNINGIKLDQNFSHQIFKKLNHLRFKQFSSEIESDSYDILNYKIFSSRNWVSNLKIFNPTSLNLNFSREYDIKGCSFYLLFTQIDPCNTIKKLKIRLETEQLTVPILMKFRNINKLKSLEKLSLILNDKINWTNYKTKELERIIQKINLKQIKISNYCISPSLPHLSNLYKILSTQNINKLSITTCPWFIENSNNLTITKENHSDIASRFENLKYLRLSTYTQDEMNLYIPWSIQHINFSQLNILKLKMINIMFGTDFDPEKIVIFKLLSQFTELIDLEIEFYFNNPDLAMEYISESIDHLHKLEKLSLSSIVPVKPVTYFSFFKKFQKIKKLETLELDIFMLINSQEEADMAIKFLKKAIQTNYYIKKFMLKFDPYNEVNDFKIYSKIIEKIRARYHHLKEFKFAFAYGKYKNIGNYDIRNLYKYDIPNLTITSN